MKKTDDKVIKESLNIEIEIWKNKYLRALADYQNLEKRIQDEREEQRHMATEDILLKLLPFVDTLEKLEKYLKDDGLSLAIKQMSLVFKEEQLEKIEVLDKKFDPVMMDCVEVVSKGNNGRVVEELSSGYKLKGKVIRVAKVKVGKEIENKI